MKKFRRSSVCQLLSFLAAMMFVVTSVPVTLFAQETSATKIKYEPIKYFVAGKRIRIAADVTDPEGIKLVRCYFKGKEQADFVFVTMTPGSSTYTAILPAAAQTASSIEYLFLAVNNKNQVIKTQQFSVNIDARQPAPPWQDVATEGQLTVSTELAQAPAVLEGFSDSIAMDLVESSARFGFVAGIYTTTQVAAAGGATRTAAAGTSAGPAATVGAGMSTIAIVGIAAGAIAVTGGVAVAAGDGGDGYKGTSPAIGGPTSFGASCASFCSQLVSNYPNYYSSCSCSDANTANGYAAMRISAKCPANGWGVTGRGWTTGNWTYNYFAAGGYTSTVCTFVLNGQTAFTNCQSSLANTFATYCSTP